MVVKVVESVNVAAAPDKAWQLVGDFGGLQNWHPAVERTDVTETGGVLGRVMHLVGGGVLVEQQDVPASGPHVSAYRLLHGPFPVTDYLASIAVTAHGSGSTVTWTAAFTSVGVSDTEARDMIAGALRSGLDTLPARLA